MSTSLGQPTIRRYRWNTSKEGNLRRKNNQSVAWYACKAVLGKEKYDRLNGIRTGTSVP